MYKHFVGAKPIRVSVLHEHQFCTWERDCNVRRACFTRTVHIFCTGCSYHSHHAHQLTRPVDVSCSVSSFFVRALTAHDCVAFFSHGCHAVLCIDMVRGLDMVISGPSVYFCEYHDCVKMKWNIICTPNDHGAGSWDLRILKNRCLFNKCLFKALNKIGVW
jgi:hypothetical protein